MNHFLSRAFLAALVAAPFAVACGGTVDGPGAANDPSQRDPNRSCGGLLGAGCANDEYCRFEIEAMCGAADQTGVCTRRPDATTTEHAPVCGCDGKTYGNAGTAALAGVSVAKLGACDEPTPTSCGGRGGNSCGTDEYCSFPADAICGRADATGVCARKPRGCSKEHRPVCGCDGQTYGNACMAAAAGVSVEKDGACGGTGKTCGTIAGLTCDRGEFCDFGQDQYCGRADGSGTCRPIPQACTEEYAPVCGCDGKTYGNACSANAAGVSVEKIGECGSAQGKACGGWSGPTCSASEFCDFPAGQMCDYADGSGVCRPRPDACPEIYAPVCGCNGKTYENECAAQRAGTDVVSTGACK